MVGHKTLWDSGSFSHVYGPRGKKKQKTSRCTTYTTTSLALCRDVVCDSIIFRRMATAPCPVHEKGENTACRGFDWLLYLLHKFDFLVLYYYLRFLLHVHAWVMSLFLFYGECPLIILKKLLGSRRVIVGGCWSQQSDLKTIVKLHFYMPPQRWGEETCPLNSQRVSRLIIQQWTDGRTWNQFFFSKTSQKLQ